MVGIIPVMHVILIGYRASGKTSVGRQLTSVLGLPFFDVDDATCERIGCDSIAQIWEEHGEPYWREHEVQATADLCRGPDCIISLGGGTLMQQVARQAVEDCHAVRIYLQCDPEEIDRRISGDSRSEQTRPSLTNLGGGLEEIVSVLEVRDPVYRAVADHVLDVTELSIEQITSKVVAWWDASIAAG